MNPSTPITPPNIRKTRNNAESSTQQPSSPQVTRIVTQEERFSPTSLFRGPSEDEQSFGVVEDKVTGAITRDIKYHNLIPMEIDVVVLDRRDR